MDLGALCASLLQQVETDRFIKCSQVNKVFDNCTTKEELELAEKVLVRFRHSLSFPRPSLPLVVVRACLRVGASRRALHYARNKLHFGVFPTRRVYKVLMEALLLEGNAKGAVAAYKLLLEDEIEPDGMVYHLAALAHARMSTAESAEASLELCRKCQVLEPRLGNKTYSMLVERLLRKERRVEEGRQLLEQLTQEGMLPSQTLFELRVECLVAEGNLAGAVKLLTDLCNRDNKELADVRAPRLGLPRLRLAVEKSDDEDLKRSLEVLLKETLPLLYKQLPANNSCFDSRTPQSHS